MGSGGRQLAGHFDQSRRESRRIAPFATRAEVALAGAAESHILCGPAQETTWRFDDHRFRLRANRGQLLAASVPRTASLPDVIAGKPARWMAVSHGA
jgi:hypothetical protein